MVPVDRVPRLGHLNSVIHGVQASLPKSINSKCFTIKQLFTNVDLCEKDSLASQTIMSAALHGHDPNRIPLFYVDSQNKIRDMTFWENGGPRALNFERSYRPFTTASSPAESGLSRQSMDTYLYYQFNGTALAEITFRDGYWNFTATIIPVQ